MTDGLTEVGEHLISSTGIAMISGVYEYTRSAKVPSEKDVQNANFSIIYKSGLILYISLVAKVEPGEKMPYDCAKVLLNLRTELVYGHTHTSINKKLREFYEKIDVMYHMTPPESE